MKKTFLFLLLISLKMQSFPKERCQDFKIINKTEENISVFLDRKAILNWKRHDDAENCPHYPKKILKPNEELKIENKWKCIVDFIEIEINGKKHQEMLVDSSTPKGRKLNNKPVNFIIQKTDKGEIQVTKKNN